MMEDISSHIMDIVMNSVTAGAQHIAIAVEKDPRTSVLSLTISDDGSGMDADMVMKVQDPFFSTKTGRKVGLGIPLLKGTAETTGGSFALTSAKGAGTSIMATFDSRHPDLPPLGNIRDTFFVLIVSHPEIDFSLRYSVDGKDFLLDTAEWKNELDGVPLNHPEVIGFLSKYLDEHL
ncbi:MAG: Histidine kinase-, gyrase and HSP90-like ATPase [Deltaproteobacteria bacterium]|nr:Histidine kinase-, gyrase and HSP90-like ATPase [Deltaproteobacteria bacterium]